MFAFRYEDDNSLIVDPNGQSFYFTLWRYSYQRDSVGECVILETMKMSYSNCKKEEFNNSRLFDEKNFKGYYCIDYNKNQVDIGGSWDANFVNYIDISYTLCPEGSTNPYNGLPCNSANVTDSFLAKNTYVTFYIQDLVVDPSNYENPIKKTIFNYYFLLDNYLFKKNYLYLVLTMVESDFGWILEDLNQITEIRFESRVTDINLREGYKIGNLKYNLGKSLIYLKKTLEKYTRKYTKIQTLVANVGGILKALTFLLGMVIQTYNYYDFKTEILNSISSISKYDKDFTSDKKKTIKINRDVDSSKMNADQSNVFNLNKVDCKKN